MKSVNNDDFIGGGIEAQGRKNNSEKRESGWDQIEAIIIC
jgi:hypothetical protein